MTSWKLFFAYEDKYNEVQLWEYSGTTGTEFTPGISSNSDGLNPNYLDVYNDELLFTGDNASGVPGLWVTNGTKPGTHEIQHIKGAFPGGLYPSYMTTYKSEVLFDGESGNFVETTHTLWVTKGTSSSTVQLGGSDNKEIKNVDETLGLLAYFKGFTRFEGVEYFAGLDAGNNIGLWRTDGTVKGTYEIKPIKGAVAVGPNGTDIQPDYMCVVGKRMFFAGEDLEDGQAGLWVTNGTGNGTYEIGGQADKGVKNSPVGNANNSEVGMGPTDIIAYKGKAIFAATDNTINPDNGYYTDTEGLWISNGTAGGTTEIGGHGSSEIKGAAKALNGGLMSNASGGGNPDFTVFDGEVYFLGVDDKSSNAGREELWVTNGTVGGTHEIGGLDNAGIKGNPKFATSEDSDSPNFTVYDGKLFFTAEVAATNEWAIWYTTSSAASSFHMVAGSERNYYPNTDFTVGHL